MKLSILIGLTFSIALLVVVLLISIFQQYAHYDTSHTITVPNDCQLQQVVAGEDYVFDCPSK